MLIYGELVIFLTLFLSIFGYIFSVMKEWNDHRNFRVTIKSESVTQEVFDEIDFKTFKFDNQEMWAGDEIRIRKRDNRSIKGILLGAQEKGMILWLVDCKDQILKIPVKEIRSLRIHTKYGRFF